MIDVIKGVKTISTTIAVRDTTIDGKDIFEGDVLGLIDNKIDLTGKDDTEVLIECLEKCIDDETGLITVFLGEGQSDTEKIKEILEEKYEDLDISVYMGNQPVYSFIASVE